MAENYYQMLFEALCTRNMNELAKAAFEILDMPVVVTDSAFIVRAKYPDRILNDEQWDANTMNRQIEPRFVKSFTDDDHFARHDEAGWSTILTDWGHYESAPRLTCILRSEDNVLGYFAALTTGVAVQSWHYEASDAIGEAFAMLMDAGSMTRLAHSGLTSPTLYAALNGRFDEPVPLDAIPGEFIERNQPPYMLFCAHTSNPHNAPLEIYLGHELVQYFECAVQTVYGGDLYILASEVAEDARGSVRGNLFAEALAKQSLLCGSSRHFDSIDEIRLRAWEARSALHVGTLLADAGPLFHYEDYVVDIVCEYIDSNIPADALENAELSALKKHDADYGTSYLETLKAYVQSGFDKKKTSEVLHVHRNTLQYRLERIQQMQGIDFSCVQYGLYFGMEDYRRRVQEASAFSTPGKKSSTKKGAK